MTMKKTMLFVLLSCLVIPAFAQNEIPETLPDGKPRRKSVVVFPAKLAFTLDRGGSASQTITVQNTTNSKFQLEMIINDWTRDTVGNHIYTAPGTNKQSCARWITFDKPFIELSPGQSTNVTVTMKVPDSAEAVAEMKWTMLIMKTVSEKKAAPTDAKYGTMVVQNIGLGVHITQTPPSVTAKEVKMVSFGEVPWEGKNTYRIACKNVGAVQMFGKFSLELSDNETGAKTALEPKTVPLFPQQDRYVDFTLPSTLKKGKYTAIALIDAGDDDVPIEAAQTEIIIK
jgi:hypothetical protein